MKQENLNALIKELQEVEELHQEYQDDDIHYVIDAKRNEEGNLQFSINVIKDNKDKENFEQFVNDMPDYIFEKTWETLSEEDNLHELDDIYNSENYKEVIEKFTETSKRVALKQLANLQEFIDNNF